jgi:hypothetical protein
VLHDAKNTKKTPVGQPSVKVSIIKKVFYHD